MIEIERLNLNDLNKWIGEKRPEVERLIIRNRDQEKLVRTCKRDEDEQKIIDKLYIRKWKMAV